MRRNSLFVPFTLLALAACALAACAHGPSQSALPSLTVPSQGLASRGYSCPTPAVRGVSPDRRRICPGTLFIVQENRTVDNLFGGPNPFPGADTVSSGRTLTGTQPLKKVFLDSVVEPDNAHPAWLRACNAPKGTGPPFSVGGPSPCQMNGFSANTDLKTGVLLRYIYSYVDYADTKEYWDIAQKYALGDHFFMGHNSESYTAHQYIFSGQSNNVVDTPVKTKLASLGCHRPLDPACVLTPWGCDSPAGTRTYFLDPNTGQESRKPVNIAPCFGYSSLAGPQYVFTAGQLSFVYLFALLEHQRPRRQYASEVWRNLARQT